jgi:hypothetical protein
VDTVMEKVGVSAFHAIGVVLLWKMDENIYVQYANVLEVWYVHFVVDTRNHTFNYIFDI